MRPGVGLCARCAHASLKRNTRGSEFWRCLAADGDAPAHGGLNLAWQS